MAATAGPDIVDNGLVLALDAADWNSFKGEATVNLISDPFSLSGFPTPVTWSGYEGTVTRTSSLPFEDMYNISPTWLQIDKTSSSNGRIAVLGVSGLQTGVDYCCSFYVYSNDTNLTSVNWLSDNGTVSTIQSYTLYTSSDRNTIKRIQTIFRSVSGSQLNVLRINATDPIGTRAFITGLQIEQKSYPTMVVNGTRGTTVATGGGWADLTIAGNNGELINGARESSGNLGSLSFDGTNDYVNAPLTKSASCTFSCWARTTTLATSPMLFNAGPDGVGPDLFFYNGKISWNTWDADVNSFGNIPASVTDGNWHYYVLVNDASSNAKLYYDGILLGTATYRNASANTNLTIGGNTNTYMWNGNISKFEIYNRVITATEVQQNFNETRSRFGI